MGVQYDTPWENLYNVYGPFVGNRNYRFLADFIRKFTGHRFMESDLKAFQWTTDWGSTWWRYPFDALFQRWSNTHNKYIDFGDRAHTLKGLKRNRASEIKY